MDGIEDAMRDRLKDVPGVTVLFTTPLSACASTRGWADSADISVRIFGPDLDELTRLSSTRQLMSGVRGVSDLRAEQVSGFRNCASRWTDPRRRGLDSLQAT
jgi:cobalt-zinc-cadmium resistance protein CzcA